MNFEQVLSYNMKLAQNLIFHNMYVSIGIRKKGGEEVKMLKDQKAKIKLPSLFKKINLRISFSLKLAIIFSVLITIILSILASIMYTEQKRVLESELEKRGRILTSNIASSCVNPMLVGEESVIRYIIDGLKSEQGSEDKSMEYVCITDKEGIIKAHTNDKQKGIDLKKIIGKEKLKSDKMTKDYLKYSIALKMMGIDKSSSIPNKDTAVMEISAPIKGPVGVLGYVKIGYSMKPINDELRSLVVKILGIISICIVISVFSCIFVARIFTRPIDVLVSATNNLAMGDLTRKVAVHSNDEIGELGSSFNTAIEKLNELIRSMVVATEEVNEFGRKVSEGSSETSLISKQVAHTIDELARGFQDQVNTINKVMSTTVELDELIQEIAKKAGMVKTASYNTVTSAQEGGKAVDITIQKVNDINNTVNQLSTIVKDLGGKSIHIGEIVHLISEIADQTNLLALNAAIEAARAGEQGRGFAVVADEVRKLAEQSASASKEISKLVIEIQNAASKAVQSIDINSTKVVEGTKAIAVVEEALNKIKEAAQNAASMVDEISEATFNQARNSKEVVAAMSSLVAVAEEAASSTQEVSASVEEQTSKLMEIESLAKDLDSTAVKLEDKVGQFKI